MNVKQMISSAVAVSVVALAANSGFAGVVGAWTFDNPSNLGEGLVGPDLIVDTTTDGGTVSAISGPGGSGAAMVSELAFLELDRTGQAPLEEYSLVYDFRNPTTRTGDGADISEEFRTILDTGNRDAGSAAHLWLRTESGFNPRGIGQGNLPSSDDPTAEQEGYSAGKFNFDEWHRLVFYGSSVADPNETDMRMTLLDSSGNVVFTERFVGESGSAGQHALLETVRFFYNIGDNETYNDEVHVAGLYLYDNILTQAEAESLGAPGTVIPEPASLALMGIGGLLMLRRRRA